MKIAMLARNPDLYSHQRLAEAAAKRGHDIEIIDTLKVYINIATDRPEIRYRGEKINGFDAVIPRIGASITLFGTAVVRQFEMMGVYSLNESVAITRSRDKLRSLQLLARKGVSLPVTVFAHATSQADDILEMLGGAPVAIKLLEGTEDTSMVLGETDRAAKSVIQAFGGIKAHILVQEYVHEAQGQDIRCLVIGDKVAAAMMHVTPKGRSRANASRGGMVEAVRITPEERAMAVKAAKSLGLNVCGVDMLRANRGPVVIDVNSTPGLEGVEEAAGVDVAGRIIEFLEKNARPNNTKTRGKG